MYEAIRSAIRAERSGMAAAKECLLPTAAGFSDPASRGVRNDKT
jgi:hypothetical protein